MSGGMETHDAHEHILVVGKFHHSLDILNQGCYPGGEKRDRDP